MKQANKIIKVILESEKEVEYLTFKFEEKDLRVNLNSPDSQAELKTVFSCLLRAMMVSPIKLELEIQKGFSRELYKDVFQEYINSLNEEIKNIKKRMDRDLVT